MPSFASGDRLPEEMPGVEWDISKGVRMAGSAVRALSRERLEAEGGEESPKVELYDDQEDLTEANHFGALALVVASRMIPDGTKQSDLCKSYVTAMTSPGFVERLMEAASQHGVPQ